MYPCRVIETCADEGAKLSGYTRKGRERMRQRKERRREESKEQTQRQMSLPSSERKKQSPHKITKITKEDGRGGHWETPKGRRREGGQERNRSHWKKTPEDWKIGEAGLEWQLPEP